MEVKPRELLMCHMPDGKIPFKEWLFDEITDLAARSRIEACIDRLEDGNMKNVNPVGEGVFELVMDFGPGYRAYFGEKGDEIHLISGGTKRRQQADIDAAKEFWKKHG